MTIIRHAKNESSLSRVFSHMALHDCGTITAHRKQYTYEENRQRNLKLKAQLYSRNLAFTEANGIYIENFRTPEAVEVRERIFFVVDRLDRGNLEKILRELGEEWDQDSILFIPRPGENSILWGTNHTGFPGYGKTDKFAERHAGSNNFEFLTRIGSRPFAFTESTSELTIPGNGMGMWSANKQAKRPWQEFGLS